MTPPMPVSRLRSAIETVEPTTCSTSAVSEVSREAISDGRFSSNHFGGRRSRLRCTATRRSATVRSATQEMKKKRMAVAIDSTRITASRPSKYTPMRLVSTPLAKPLSTIFWKVRGIYRVASDEVTSAIDAMTICNG